MTKYATGYPASGPLTGAETLQVVRAGADLQAAVSDIAIYARGADYISWGGLQLLWAGAQAISITSGMALLPNGTVINSATTINLTSLGLAASTLYHVYLYSNAGTPSAEVVTTAPSATYYGSARGKTGDTSRRYLGSIYTNASTAGIARFYHDIQAAFMSVADPTRERVRVLSGGTSTTAATVSFSSIVPITAVRGNVRVIVTSPSGGPGVNISNPDLGALGNTGAGNYLYTALAASDTSTSLPFSSTQSLNYVFSSAPASGGLFMDLFGYTFQR